MEIAGALSCRLKRQREAKELSRSKLSALSGVSRNSIIDYEKGRFMPSTYTLVQLAVALGVSTDYLVGLSDFPEPTEEALQDVYRRFALLELPCGRKIYDAFEQPSK